jgi:glycosyltransferase involved in cell wall biosynthesis
MACGTPVIGFNLGSIPEIVKNGKTGFVVNTVEEMVAAIGKISTISRKSCRRYALANFGAERMTDGYEAIYTKLLRRTKLPTQKVIGTVVPRSRFPAM